MALVPLSYNFRSLWVRRSATLLTALGIGATVAVVSGVLSLQQGFTSLFKKAGRSDVMIVLRPGASNEGDSAVTRESARILINSHPEIAGSGGSGDQGGPMASAESFLALRLKKLDGGETNVPIRGVQQRSFDIAGDKLQFIRGRRFTPGADEVIVGQRMGSRLQDCELDDVLQINTIPCRVVGIFAYDGPFESEIWMDVERMLQAIQRPVYSRVIAVVPPEKQEAFAAAVKADPQVPAEAMTETEYLTKQTGVMGDVLAILGQVLAIIMGIAAIFTATNTMLAAIVARTHEIGILLSIGFRPFAIFLSFLFEALFLCLVGGVLGVVLTLPLNGIETGAMNWNTFTDVSFAFRTTPAVLVAAVVFASALGILGGLWPAWRASRLRPTQALRRQ